MEASAADNFYALRRCFREPIRDIFAVADMLSQATDAHLDGDRRSAAALIVQADSPVVRAWTDSLWGSPSLNPDQASYLRVRAVENGPPILPKEARLPVRMPTRAEKASLVDRFGHRCAFCGIPAIRAEIRKAFQASYPEEAYWGATTATCHAAFQCMWLQYDHVLPHSRGGDNSLENLVITCAGCNYGRMSMTLDEVGLIDPRTMPIEPTDWDGLERILPLKPPR